MLPYNRIPIWLSYRREKKLQGFRDLVVNLFYRVSNTGEFTGRKAAGDLSEVKIRSEININLLAARDLVIAAGIPTVIINVPSVYQTQVTTRHDLFYDLLTLRHGGDIEPIHVIDCIDRAIGRYQSDRTRAWLRTFNPIFWLSLLTEYIAKTPFRFLQRIGIAGAGTESTAVGKLIRGMLELVAYIAAILTIVEVFGVKNEIAHFFQSVFASASE